MNALVGCQKCGPDCDNCYAIEQAHVRAGNPLPVFQDKFGGTTAIVNGRRNWTGKVTVTEKALFDPLAKKSPRTYFVNALSDLFYDGVPDEIVDRHFAVFAQCPQHTFQILTKRPERMLAYFRRKETANTMPAADAVAGILHDEYGWSDARALELQWPLPNVWLGTSICDQSTANKRIPPLLDVPAAVRFVSYEPALGSVDFTRIDVVEWTKKRYRLMRSECEAKGDTASAAMFTGMLDQIEMCNWEEGRAWRNALNGDWFDGWDSGCGKDDGCPGLDWIIVGGESGHKARPFDVDWARRTIAQCQVAQVPVFVKQIGRRPRGHFEATVKGLEFVGKGWGAVHDSSGSDMSEWPVDLRIRQFPEVQPA